MFTPQKWQPPWQFHGKHIPYSDILELKISEKQDETR